MSLSPTEVVIEGDIVMADLSSPSETIVLKDIAELMEETSNPIQVQDAFLPAGANSVLNGLTPMTIQGGVDPLLSSNYVDQQVAIQETNGAKTNAAAAVTEAVPGNQTSPSKVSEKWKNTLRQMIKITNDFLTSSKQLLDESKQQSAQMSEEKTRKNRNSRPKKNFGKTNDHNGRTPNRYGGSKNYQSYNYQNPWRNDYANR